MRNGKLRAFLIALMLLVFASGLTFLLYPYLWGAMVDREISLNAQGFLNRDKTEPTISEVIVTIDSPTEPEETKAYPELWADMVRYNETIYTQGQTGLSCEYDYQKPSLPNISLDFWASVVERPAILRIFVYKNKFL